MWVQGDKKHLKNIPKNKERSHSRLTRSLTAKSIHKKTHHHECGQKCSSCSEDSDTLIQGHFVGLTVFIALLIHRHTYLWWLLWWVWLGILFICIPKLWETHIIIRIYVLAWTVTAEDKQKRNTRNSCSKRWQQNSSTLDHTAKQWAETHKKKN